MSDLLETANDLVLFLRQNGYRPPGLESLLVAVEKSIEDVTMCTCHGFESAGNACVDHCGKERL